MPNTKWSELSAMQLGRYAEYYAKMEFTSYGFDVYTAEVDDHGVDFIAKSKNGIYFEVQVKSVRNDNYVFISKDKIVIDKRHLVCYIRFVEDCMPDCYVFPATVWKDPDGSLFVERNYEGKKSKPEYGIQIKKKENLQRLQKYSIENSFSDINRYDNN